MKNIVPHLWFDKNVKQAVEFYTSIFSNSKITSMYTLHDTPSGDTNVVSFELGGMPFLAINGGPYFKLNPSISFFVNFDPSKEADAKDKIDHTWEKLFEGGKALMPLQEYPFSKYYGWVEDKYGVSWQLILTDAKGEDRPNIVPSLLFVGDKAGKAEEAIKFYLSVFKESKMGEISRYGAGQAPDKEGTVTYADFKLLDTWFAAMDSARDHKFAFNEAISFMVNCETQEEIDYYWNALSAIPESEQCGWLKDKYGVSWQIVPHDLEEMIQKGTPEQADRVTKAFMPMKKLIIADLHKAYRGV